MSGQELLFAAEEGKKDVVVRLLNRGANIIYYENRFRETALYCACNGWHSDLALLLIERGADVNAATKWGKTPLMVASLRCKLHVVKRLLDKGANIDGVDKRGKTALRLACCYSKSDAALLLIERGADVNLADADGTTPLISASERNLVDVVKSLLYKGSNVNARNNEGLTALHCAISYPTVVALFEKEADIHAIDNEGRNALHHAAVRGNVNIVRFLLSKGSDYNTVDINGKRPLDLARDNNSTEVMEIIKNQLESDKNSNVVKESEKLKQELGELKATLNELLKQSKNDKLEASKRESELKTTLGELLNQTEKDKLEASKRELELKTTLDEFLKQRENEKLEATKRESELNGELTELKTTFFQLLSETKKDKLMASRTERELKEELTELKAALGHLLNQTEKDKLEASKSERELKITLDELLKQRENEKLESTERERKLIEELTELKAALGKLLNQTEKYKLEASKTEHEMKEDMDNLKIKLEGLVSGVAVASSSTASSAQSAEVIMPQIVAPPLAKMTESCKEIADNFATKPKLVASKPERDNWRFKIESKLNSTEQEQILNTLEINGVPEKSDENLISILASIVHHLGLAFPSDLIRVCRQTSVFPEATNKPRSIVVTFQRVETAQTWLKAFREKRSTGILASSLDKSFKDDKIYINQKLTHFNKKLLHRVKEFAKTNQYKFVWVQDGKILLRKNEDAPIIRIKSDKDIPPQ